jgi:hypothetical protein
MGECDAGVKSRSDEIFVAPGFNRGYENAVDPPSAVAN